MFQVSMNGKFTNFKSASKVYSYVSLIANHAADYDSYSDPVVLRDGAVIKWNDLVRLMGVEAHNNAKLSAKLAAHK